MKKETYSLSQSISALKQGQALIHSSGSISPSPSRSGLRSRCPQTRHPGKSFNKVRIRTRSECFCQQVRVSFGCPMQTKAAAGITLGTLRTSSIEFPGRVYRKTSLIFETGCALTSVFICSKRSSIFNVRKVFTLPSSLTNVIFIFFYYYFQ